MDLTFYEWEGGNATDITPVPSDSATLLINGDGGRMRSMIRFPYGVFGTVQADEVLNFNTSLEKTWMPFADYCYQESLESLPLNFTKMVSDLFDEKARFTIYEPEGAHPFDISPMWVFHTRKILSKDVGKMWFYFDQVSGDLKWMMLEGHPYLMRVNKGMQHVDFTDADFEVKCTPKKQYQHLRETKSLTKGVFNKLVKLYQKYL